MDIRIHDLRSNLFFIEANNIKIGKSTKIYLPILISVPVDIAIVKVASI